MSIIPYISLIFISVSPPKLLRLVLHCVHADLSFAYLSFFSLGWSSVILMKHIYGTRTDSVFLFLLFSFFFHFAAWLHPMTILKGLYRQMPTGLHRFFASSALGVN